jgi:uncharacterized protein (DUF2062 family)
MTRPFLRRIAARAAPLTAAITGNRWLARRLPALANPDLWHFNRHSTARGVAIGLACGLIPGPGQAVVAALGCVLCRGNLPIAVAATFYTNPLTIVPLYAAAWQAGSFVLPTLRSAGAPAPPTLSFDLDGLASFLHWATSIGPALAVGLPLLAVLFAAIGFVAVHILWRWHTLRAWRRRALLRQLRELRE